MTEFHNKIRNILKDVETLLVVDLHEQNLPYVGRDRKNTILNNLHQLRQDFPELLTHAPVKPPSDRTSLLSSQTKKKTGGKLPLKNEPQEPVMEETYEECDISVSGGSDHVSSTKEDTNSLNEEECAYGSYNKDFAVSDLQNPNMAGFLEKKRKKEGSKLLSMFSPYQRRYCVVKGNVLFYFATETDTKQHGAILLTDYEVRPYTDKDKFTFELVAPAKRTYQFAASSQEDLENWISALERGSSLTPEHAEAEDEIYAEADDFVIQPSPPMHKPPSLITGVVEDTYDDTVIPVEEEMYDDTVDPPPQETKFSKMRGHLPSPPGSGRGRAPPPAIDEELYDDTVEPPSLLPHMPKSSPLTPKGRGPLPPPPGAEKGRGPPPPVPTTPKDSQAAPLEEDFYDDTVEPSGQLPQQTKSSPPNVKGRGPLPAAPNKGRVVPPPVPGSTEKGRAAPPPVPGTPSPVSTAVPEDDQDIYDDVENVDETKSSGVMPPPLRAVNSGVTNQHRDQTNVSPAQIVDDNDIYDDICEPVDNTGPRLPTNTFLDINSKAPPVGKPQPESIEDIEYEKIYCGLWDCHGDEANELSFKRGDLIYIVNKDYDSFSWWVGELHGKVGLVPKAYLMEAYEVVIE